MEAASRGRLSATSRRFSLSEAFARRCDEELRREVATGSSFVFTFNYASRCRGPKLDRYCARVPRILSPSEEASTRFLFGVRLGAKTERSTTVASERTTNALVRFIGAVKYEYETLTQTRVESGRGIRLRPLLGGP